MCVGKDAQHPARLHACTPLGKVFIIQRNIQGCTILRNILGCIIHTRLHHTAHHAARLQFKGVFQFKGVSKLKLSANP